VPKGGVGVKGQTRLEAGRAVRTNCCGLGWGKTGRRENVLGSCLPMFVEWGRYLTGTSNVYNIRKMLVLPSARVRSNNEILVFEYRSLTGIERDLIYEGR
jgi:hypothetical protein